MANADETNRWVLRELSELPPDVQTEILKHRKQAVAYQFSGPAPILMEFQGYIFRAIKNRLYWRKKHTTYVDFLLDLIKAAFGQNWHSEQVSLPHSQRHIVMRWMKSWFDYCQSQRPQDLPDETVIGSVPTGDGQALITLADDLYRLQLARCLPSKLMHRLRQRTEFQSARYEIQVASIFLRCGFEIEWTEEESTKRCEFHARHRSSGLRMAVEAKSRRRRGVLEEPGTFDESHDFGFENLYEDAKAQNPKDCPFCIFVDVNVRPRPEFDKWSKPWIA